MDECYAIGTNPTIGTNGRVECTPTQCEADEIFCVFIMRYISPFEYQWIPHNEMHFTNGIPRY